MILGEWEIYYLNFHSNDGVFISSKPNHPVICPKMLILSQTINRGSLVDWTTPWHEGVEVYTHISL